ncbi:MAG TPA: ATP-binding cassette domain-containing protein [Burkholderiales bacterium]|nr:ATP-binding cassette domain-containing protein [Burkholderiales bacterium]
MIQVENLSKTFGPKLAVDRISFAVERGEVLGFLGPNGAGKSTTMRIITGFYPATSGAVRVGGFDIAEHPLEAKRLFGYLPENAPSYADMTVYGFLGFCAEMRGLAGDAKKRAIGRVVEMCFLESVLYQSVDTLSKGYRHRTCLAQSLIHDPGILVLDEPTDGLDPNQKHEVRTLIKSMGENKAIVFSTHILEEVEAACTRAIIIDRGRIVANGTPGELKRKSDVAGAVVVAIAGDAAAAAVTDKLAALPGVRGCERLGAGAGPLRLRVLPATPGADGTLTRAIGELAAQERWRIEELSVEEGRLDEVFRSITLPETVKSAPAPVQEQAA